MDISQVCWDIDNLLNDTIDDISGIVVNMSAYSLVATAPGLFTIETDINGKPWLCTPKIVGYDIVLTFNNAAYSRSPIPFKPVYIIGPHPIKIFTLKPGR